MKVRQYGVFINTYERETKEFTPIILVFYDLKEALSMDKEYRNLDSIPYYEKYLERLNELKEISNIRLQEINIENIKQKRDKSFYTDNIIGEVALINSTPIKIEGWFLVGGDLD